MSRFITVEVDGEVLVHLPGVISDYATLCGLDGDDPVENMRTLETKRGAKVTCEHCQAIWRACKDYRSTSFDMRPYEDF